MHLQERTGDIQPRARRGRLRGHADRTDTRQHRAELVVVANELGAILPRVRSICVAAQASSPSTGLDIPGAFLQVHRALSRAGNTLATTAEAAAMTRLDGERWGVASSGLDNVRRRAQLVVADVDEAERSMPGAR